MKKYEEPVINVQILNVEDIIMTSGGREDEFPIN